MKRSSEIENMEIDNAIGLIQDQKQKRMLAESENSYEKGDSFRVISHDRYFEIIVTNSSDKKLYRRG